MRNVMRRYGLKSEVQAERFVSLIKQFGNILPSKALVVNDENIKDAMLMPNPEEADKYTQYLRAFGLYHQRRTKQFLLELKNRGYYKTNADELFMRSAPDAGSLEDFDYRHPEDALSRMNFLFSTGINMYLFRFFSFDDDDWMDAIESAVLNSSPEIIMADSWIPYFDQLRRVTELNLIWSTVMRVVISHDGDIVNGLHLANAFYSTRQDVHELTAERDELQRALDRLQSKCAGLQQEVASLRCELDERERKASAVLVADHNRQLQARDSEIERLRKRVEQLETERLEVVPLSTSDTESGQSSNDLIPLPERGVLFLGGHVNMVNKLKATHKGWAYSGVDEPVPVGLKLEFIACFSTHVNHTSFNKVRALYPDIPIFYVSEVNLSLLHQRLQQSYTEYCLLNGQADSDISVSR